ncbi:regulator of nucleoside diphosphate kinase [Crenobacter luteus]|uniref:Transcription elongation factor GreAB n=1 Tax=Crenobacter luteus TaxID=1452487 RepID=A0A161TMC0_9NEIS|nr:nucleoside diphosphate kinase regulator [Crenobacter luteus]KZE27298.1 hypothetical protein AVW16_01760 [Crenobacter luteus]TCP10319.1 regulator of nucleoside diphosphate kinase [Crenobacter luteus]
MSTLPAITVSSLDYARLSALIDRTPAKEVPGVTALEAELERADVLEPAEMPAGVITMNSRATVRDEANGEVRTLTLVYPQDADLAAGKISILAPVGSALLGLSVGQAIDWPLPTGGTTRLVVLSVDWQPEAAGELTL